jgi:hypothetical protein
MSKNIYRQPIKGKERNILKYYLILTLIKKYNIITELNINN